MAAHLMTSHLVETMMINVGDFSENFLTCGTCLSGYDSSNNSAKLLPCSHTICRSCLLRIIETQMNEETFNCPICRELIPIPRGGADTFPPAFILNQLLDLLASQRHDRVPKCRLHLNQELLFCETCDIIFCPDCRGRGTRGHATEPCGANPNLSIATDQSSLTFSDVDLSYTRSPLGQDVLRGLIEEDTSSVLAQRSQSMVGGAALSHNVISFSVAIKRCSQILLYKAHLCIQELNSAKEAVSVELSRLTESSSTCISSVESSFSELKALVERRQSELLHNIYRLTEEKRRALSDQLALIESERDLVKKQCDELNEMMDVRSISKGISYLNDKLDTLASLTEPRENAFLRFHDKPIRSSSVAGTRSVDSPISPEKVLLHQSFSPTPIPITPILSTAGSSSILDVARCLAAFGRIAVSTTYPPLCSAKIPDEILLNLTSKVVVHAFDYHGQPQTTGTDPIAANFNDQHGREAPSQLVDIGDGSYEITLLPMLAGQHTLSINILGRPIRGSPFDIFVRPRQAPRWCLNEGLDGRALVQPFAVSFLSSNSLAPIDHSHNSLTTSQENAASVETAVTSLSSLPLEAILLLDTGNSRLLVVDSATGHVKSMLVNDALKGQAATGMAVSSDGVWIVNWRSNELLLLDLSTNQILRRVTSPLFVEPTSVCVCPCSGRVLIVDNGAGCLFECSFDTDPPPEFSTEKKTAPNASPNDPMGSAVGENAPSPSPPPPSHCHISSLSSSFHEGLRKVTGICVTSSGEIVLAAGSQLQICSSNGRHICYLPLSNSVPCRPSFVPCRSTIPEEHGIESTRFTRFEPLYHSQRTSTLPTTALQEGSRGLPFNSRHSMCSSRSSRVATLDASFEPSRAVPKGLFGGVCIGSVDAGGDRADDGLGECILATHTDRSRSAIIVWPESVWRSFVSHALATSNNVICVPSSLGDCASVSETGDSQFDRFTGTLESSRVSHYPHLHPKCAYSVEVYPQMRRLVGLTALPASRFAVAVDLGGQSAHCIRYA